MAILKVWNGSGWLQKPVKVYNGSTWLTKPVKMYIGSTWTCIANCVTYGSLTYVVSYISDENADCCGTYQATVDWTTTGTDDTNYAIDIGYYEDSGSYVDIVTDVPPSYGTYVHEIGGNRQGPSGTLHSQYFRVVLKYQGTPIQTEYTYCNGSYTTPCNCY